MPIYEYLCSACGHTLDALQKVSDEPLRRCPHCEKPALKRQLSAPRFRLKGGGWYETDFKGKNDKRRNLAEADGKAATPEQSTGKTADKPAKVASKPASGKADDVA